MGLFRKVQYLRYCARGVYVGPPAPVKPFGMAGMVTVLVSDEDRADAGWIYADRQHSLLDLAQTEALIDEDMEII